MWIGDDRLHMMSSSFPSILSFNCQVQCHMRVQWAWSNWIIFKQQVKLNCLSKYKNWFMSLNTTVRSNNSPRFSSIHLLFKILSMSWYDILWWWCYCCRVKRSSKNINNFHRSENCICFDCQFVPIEFVQAVYCVMQIYPISRFVIFDQLVILFFFFANWKSVKWLFFFSSRIERERWHFFSDWSITIHHFLV
jgi:hypothetical protein